MPPTTPAALMEPYDSAIYAETAGLAEEAEGQRIGPYPGRGRAIVTNLLAGIHARGATIAMATLQL